MEYRHEGRTLYPTVEIYHDIIPYLAGITMRDFFMEPAKCADAWQAANEILGAQVAGRFPLRKPSPAPLSYGHLICLGAPVSVPEDGEPNVGPFVGSVGEGIELLKAKKGMDFEQNDWYRHYLDMWACLRGRFPEENIAFSGFGAQGPITTAVLMRGQDFYFDLYDEPEKCRELLQLLVDSIVDFIRCERKINGKPERAQVGYIADDFASLIAPDMWPDFVLPPLLQEYRLLSGGRERKLHMENLSPAHIPLLNELQLTHFQPSVSDLLTTEVLNGALADGTAYDWLLYAYRVTEMTDAQIQAWVDATVGAGVSIIRTQVGAYACMEGKLDRAFAFHDAFQKYRI